MLFFGTGCRNCPSEVRKLDMVQNVHFDSKEWYSVFGLPQYSGAAVISRVSGAHTFDVSERGRVATKRKRPLRRPINILGDEQRDKSDQDLTRAWYASTTELAVEHLKGAESLVSAIWTSAHTQA